MYNLVFYISIIGAQILISVVWPDIFKKNTGLIAKSVVSHSVCHTTLFLYTQINDKSITPSASGVADVVNVMKIQ